MKAILFLNYSDEDFTATWDSVPYTVKAGQSMLLQDYIAKHLAEHLTMREMNRADKNVLINRESASFQAKVQKALPGDVIEAESPEKLEMKVVEAKKKAGRPKKEVEFPDLKK